MTLDVPEGYQHFIIAEVLDFGDTWTIKYGGRAFGGIVPAWISDPVVLGAIRPGAEIIVRHHETAAGQRGPTAHLLIRHPTEAVWAELYIDSDTQEGTA